MAAIGQLNADIKKQIAQCELLSASLHEGVFEPAQWGKYNSEYSRLLKKEIEIVGTAEAIGDPQIPSIMQAFKKAVIGHQVEIMERMKTAARAHHLDFNIRTGAPVAPTPPPAPEPSLASRVVKGLWNHSGKIAFVASMYLLAGQTPAGAKLLADAGTRAAAMCEPLKQTVVQGINYLSANRAAITSILSGYATLTGAKKLWSAGSKKLACAYLLAGSALTAAPHVLKPGVISKETWDQASAAWDKTRAFATDAFTAVSGVVSKWTGSQQPVREL
ncbi:MAG: hypothetical protein K1X28_07905 [Parachlamydiales bacterium]|nr:hypothetical protein [Parachlamydiales bacterium]